MSKRDAAFELFAQGMTPSSPELQALGLAKNTLKRYYHEWHKLQTPPGPAPESAVVPTEPTELETVPAEPEVPSVSGIPVSSLPASQIFTIASEITDDLYKIHSLEPDFAILDKLEFSSVCDCYVVRSQRRVPLDYLVIPKSDLGGVKT